MAINFNIKVVRHSPVHAAAETNIWYMEGSRVFPALREHKKNFTADAWCEREGFTCIRVHRVCGINEEEQIG